jgi:hypothetical protein
VYNVIGMVRLMGTLKALDGLGDPANAKEIVKASRDAAFNLRDHIRAGTPKGPTGNLWKGVQAGTFKKRGGKPITSFVRMSSRIAPHAHLVEFGARAGKMPANPFFRRGAASGAQAALDAVVDGASKAIDSALK